MTDEDRKAFKQWILEECYAEETAMAARIAALAHRDKKKEAGMDKTRTKDGVLWQVGDVVWGHQEGNRYLRLKIKDIRGNTTAAEHKMSEYWAPQAWQCFSEKPKEQR